MIAMRMSRYQLLRKPYLCISCHTDQPQRMKDLRLQSTLKEQLQKVIQVHRPSLNRRSRSSGSTSDSHHLEEDSKEGSHEKSKFGGVMLQPLFKDKEREALETLILTLPK